MLFKNHSFVEINFVNEKNTIFNTVLLSVRFLNVRNYYLSWYINKFVC